MRLGVVLASILVACGGASGYQPPIPSGSNAAAVRSPGSGASFQLPTQESGISDQRRLVIRDQAAWVGTWREIVAGRFSPEPPVPDVDFSKEMVLVASMGEHPRTGYQIRFDGVFVRSDGNLTAAVTEDTTDPSGCAFAAVMTQPVDAVVVEKALDVTFAERKQTSPCGQ